MHLPIEWLKEFVTVSLTPNQLAHRLTMAGLEIGAVKETESGPVFDIEITPNRPDWLSIIGIAREVAAVTGASLKLKPQGAGKNKRHKTPGKSGALQVIVEDRKACPRYIGRLIENVSVGPSPDWMQRRLIACGARPINNIVDITNYVLFECGQPLHAFDAGRLAQETICVRRARPGESLTTLDGVARKLTPDILVIADGKQPAAVAGIMGGESSGVTAQTTRLVLESALFDPIMIRRAGRKLSVSSESSYRFERGVDPQGVLGASERAAALIQELAGGKEMAVINVGAANRKPTPITLEPARLQQWLGIPINATALKKTFISLGCSVAAKAGKPSMTVVPPSYRSDLVRDVDLYEEAARVMGYDRIKATLPLGPVTTTSTERQDTFTLTQKLRVRCASLGLQEVVTWSLLSQSELVRCGWADKASVSLVNPLSQDHAHLRPSLLPGMLQVVRRNFTQGALGVRLFEVGHIAVAGVPAGQTEQMVAGIALSGTWLRDWKSTDASGFFRLKGLIEAATAGFCAQALEFVSKRHVWAQPEESTEIHLNGKRIGEAGLVSRSITKALDIEQDVWFAQLDAAPLLLSEHASRIAHAPSGFPPVKRDLSVLLNREVAFKTVHQTILDTAGAWAARVELIDRYTGKPVAENQYSATFSIEYRDSARTLTAAEVDAVHQRVTQVLVDRFGAVRR